MNLKITLLSALLISASVQTINAMSYEELFDLRAHLLKLNLDLNNLSYRTAQTIAQNPNSEFNIKNYNILTATAKSTIDIAVLNHKINNLKKGPDQAAAKNANKSNLITLQMQQLQLMAINVAATQFTITNEMLNFK